MYASFFYFSISFRHRLSLLNEYHEGKCRGGDLKEMSSLNTLRGSYMIGKIPTWWENSVRGNRKTVGKNSAMVGNFPQREKKSLPLHGSFSTAASVLYAGIYLPLFSQCRAIRSGLGGCRDKYTPQTLPC
jgi:hypothetical protein